MFFSLHVCMCVFFFFFFKTVSPYATQTGLKLTEVPIPSDCWD